MASEPLVYRPARTGYPEGPTPPPPSLAPITTLADVVKGDWALNTALTTGTLGSDPDLEPPLPTTAQPTFPINLNPAGGPPYTTLDFGSTISTWGNLSYSTLPSTPTTANPITSATISGTVTEPMAPPGGGAVHKFTMTFTIDYINGKKSLRCGIDAALLAAAGSAPREIVMGSDAGTWTATEG